MCRYAINLYKPHYVCFGCRKTFKQLLVEDMVIQNGEWDAYKNAYVNYNSFEAKNFRKNNPELIQYFETRYIYKKHLCPDCGKEMHNIGLDFKAPKKEKIKEWKIVEGIYKVGQTFHSCGCNGPGYVPQNQEDYREYLNAVKKSYQDKLIQRDKAFTEQEFKDYLDYWNDKLLSVNNEINKIDRS